MSSTISVPTAALIPSATMRRTGRGSFASGTTTLARTSSIRSTSSGRVAPVKVWAARADGERDVVSVASKTHCLQDGAKSVGKGVLVDSTPGVGVRAVDPGVDVTVPAHSVREVRRLR